MYLFIIQCCRITNPLNLNEEYEMYFPNKSNNLLHLLRPREQMTVFFRSFNSSILVFNPSPSLSPPSSKKTFPRICKRLGISFYWLPVSFASKRCERLVNVCTLHLVNFEDNHPRQSLAINTKELDPLTTPSPLKLRLSP